MPIFDVKIHFKYDEMSDDTRVVVLKIFNFLFKNVCAQIRNNSFEIIFPRTLFII